MIVVELTAAIDAAGTLLTLLIGEESFSTGPNDTPANTPVRGRFNDAQVAVTAFANGRTTGGTRLEQGELHIANEDGALDAWRTYGFDGRPVVIRTGPRGAPYPAGFQTVVTATVDGAVEASRDELVLYLKDKSEVLTLPALSTRYAGSNVGSVGIEGTASDIQGKVKPRLYGQAFQMTPVPVNTAVLCYQISDQALASVEKVSDAGADLTAGTDYPDHASLFAATISAGTYATCRAEGLIRLGSTPSGTLTVDATGGAGATTVLAAAPTSTRTAAQILRALALAAGVAASDINAGDVANLDAANPAVVGIHIADETTNFLDAMDRIAASVGAYYGFDRHGQLRMGRLDAPNAAPTLNLTDSRDLDLTLTPLQDAAVPVWSVTVNHTQYETTQTTGLAGSVGAQRRGELALASRSVNRSNAAVKQQYLLASAMTVDTQLVDGFSAAIEADRLLALYSVRREQFQAPVPLSLFLDADPALLDTALVTASRFGLGSGRLYALLGYHFALADGQVTVDLWG